MKRNGTPGSGNLLNALNANGSIASAPGLPNPVHLDFYETAGGNAETTPLNLYQLSTNSSTPTTDASGINGESVWGDPSFNGTTDEFRFVRLEINQDEVIQDYLDGPQHVVPTVP